MGPIGNESLKPEKSTGWDIGVEQYFLEGQILLSATYFKNDYTNLIQFDSLQGYTNLGDAESKGIELFTQFHSRSGLILNVSYTRAEARDLDADNPLLRRPKDKFSASILYPFLRKGNIRLSLIHIGEREDLDFSTWPADPITLDDYTLLNSVISYDINRQIQVSLRMDNILNEKYELIKGYGVPGFSVYGGLHLLF